jgi:hypothetical protein
MRMKHEFIELMKQRMTLTVDEVAKIFADRSKNPRATARWCLSKYTRLGYLGKDEINKGNYYVTDQAKRELMRRHGCARKRMSLSEMLPIQPEEGQQED